LDKDDVVSQLVLDVIQEGDTASVANAIDSKSLYSGEPTANGGGGKKNLPIQEFGHRAPLNRFTHRKALTASTTPKISAQRAIVVTAAAAVVVVVARCLEAIERQAVNY
jgi:hypothetical protein